MGEFPKYTKVVLNGIDVSEHVIFWEAEDEYNDAIGSAKITVSKNINNAILINKLNTPGKPITIQRGISTSDEEWVFRGEVIDVVTDSGRYVLNCNNKYFEAVRSEITTSFDINIDEEEGKGNLIFESIITKYTTLTVLCQETPSDILITKFKAQDADVFEAAERVVKAYNWQHYYDNELDTVIFEPKGYELNPVVLEVGVNVVNKPKWKYSKEQLINELKLKGAEQSVQRSVFFNGTNLDGQTIQLGETPTSVKIYAGSGSFDPYGTGTKPSNNEANLKVGGKKGSTSGEYDYQYDDDARVRIIYFYNPENGEQPSFKPPSGTNNIEVQYTYTLPTPVIDKRPTSIENYGLHKVTHTRLDIKNIADAEVYVQTTLDAFEEPMIGSTLQVSYVPNLKVGKRHLIIDSFENIEEEMIITKIKKQYPYISDEVTVGDEVLRVDRWEISTMDRIKRLEEVQGESEDLLLHIIKNKRTVRAEKRYFEMHTKSVAGETGIYGHPIYGLYGTAKYGSTVESSFIIGHPQFGVLGLMNLGEVEEVEWKVIRIVQGETGYREFLYDDRFFDSDRSDAGVVWDTTDREITIPPQQNLYTKTLELNSHRTTFNVRFGLQSINLENMEVYITHNNSTWIQILNYNQTINFPEPATDIRLRIFNKEEI